MLYAFARTWMRPLSLLIASAMELRRKTQASVKPYSDGLMVWNIDQEEIPSC